MSVIVTMEFHLEGEPLRVAYSPLARGIADDTPRHWCQVLQELEGALAAYTVHITAARRRLEAELAAAASSGRHVDGGGGP